MVSIELTRKCVKSRLIFVSVIFDKLIDCNTIFFITFFRYWIVLFWPTDLNQSSNQHCLYYSHDKQVEPPLKQLNTELSIERDLSINRMHPRAGQIIIIPITCLPPILSHLNSVSNIVSDSCGRIDIGQTRNALSGASLILCIYCDDNNTHGGHFCMSSFCNSSIITKTVNTCHSSKGVYRQCSSFHLCLNVKRYDTHMIMRVQTM